MKIFTKVLPLFGLLLVTGKMFSQNVGIGTSTPTSKLHVIGNFTTEVDSSTFTVKGSTADMALFHRYKNLGSTGTAASFQRIGAAEPWIDGYGVNIDFSMKDSSGKRRELGIVHFSRRTNDSSSAIRLYTYKNSVATIGLVQDENQNIGLGTLYPTARLHVIGNIKMVDNNEGSARVLTSDSTGLGTWAPLPGYNSGFKATQTTGQIISSNTPTTVLWPTKLFDDAHAFTGNGFTTPFDGLYHFDLKVNWDVLAGAGSFSTSITLLKNGSAVAFTTQNIPASTPGLVTLNINTDLKLAAGDILTLSTIQQSGLNISFSPGEAYMSFSGHRIY